MGGAGGALVLLLVSVLRIVEILSRIVADTEQVASNKIASSTEVEVEQEWEEETAPKVFVRSLFIIDFACEFMVENSEKAMLRLNESPVFTQSPTVSLGKARPVNE